MTPSETGRPGLARSGRVRFATFNVLHGRTLVDGSPVSVRAADGPAGPLARAVASLDADVVALQEVDRLQERSGGVDQAFAAAMGAGAPHWRYASAFHGMARPGGGWVPEPSEPGLRVYGPREAEAGEGAPSHGVALLSRLPVLHWRARRLAPAPVPMPLRTPGRRGLTVSRDQPRAALAAVLEGSRGPFTVVALHLSFVPGWNVRQLLAVRSWTADLPGPRVLLGDFNLPGALPRTVLGPAGPLGGGRSGPGGGRPGRPGVGARRGWRDLARTPTYPAHRPLVQLDHVLATGIDPGAVTGAHAPSTPVSDHRPLVVDLLL
ncbi:endonuclease/exonuclease/phosphatase family protein [Streptomyces aureus]|uniref:endonuclease/exonuclease/phosphatase family protein n=1 Tax=Streptomyces aureus TaxID=193461 RepID=UPI00068DDE49|nr:endonuclease/exonuclease/phosphatase family protein [Streptomyces aureus]